MKRRDFFKLSAACMTTATLSVMPGIVSAAKRGHIDVIDRQSNLRLTENILSGAQATVWVMTGNPESNRIVYAYGSSQCPITARAFMNSIGDDQVQYRWIMVDETFSKVIEDRDQKDLEKLFDQVVSGRGGVTHRVPEREAHIVYSANQMSFYNLQKRISDLREQQGRRKQRSYYYPTFVYPAKDGESLVINHGDFGSLDKSEVSPSSSKDLGVVIDDYPAVVQTFRRKEQWVTNRSERELPMYNMPSEDALVIDTIKSGFQRPITHQMEGGWVEARYLSGEDVGVFIKGGDLD